MDQKQIVRDEEGKAQIVAALAGEVGVTKRKLRSVTGISAVRLDRLLSILEGEGRIASTETTSRGNLTYCYELAPIEDD